MLKPELRRPTAILAALAVCAALSGCIFTSDYGRATVPASTSAVMPVASPVGVDVKSQNGRIVIIQDSTASEATVSAMAKLQDQDRAERFTIETTLDDNGTLVVRPVWPDGKRRRNESCSFEITAPALHGIVADTSNGSITLRGGMGKTRLESSNGAIRVEGRQGGVYARTSNGRIELDRCTGDFDLNTSNGAVKISGSAPATGEAFAWHVSTSNGSITLDLDQPLVARLNASTSNGRAKLERTTSGGDTRRLVSGRSIEFGDGPGEVTLKTSNGAITVRTP